jgi:hypothetical protein
MFKNVIYEYYRSYVTFMEKLTVLLTDKTYRIKGEDSNIDIFRMFYFLCMSDAVHEFYSVPGS